MKAFVLFVLAVFLSSPVVSWAAVEDVDIAPAQQEIIQTPSEDGSLPAVLPDAGAANVPASELGVESVPHAGAEAHDDGHGEKSGGLPQLDPTWYASQFFWIVLAFVLMYLPFRYRVLPDLSFAIDTRREKIDGDLLAARDLKEEAEAAYAAYEAVLLEAREKSSALYIRVQEKMKEKEQEEFEAFKHKTEIVLANAEKEILKAKKEAMQDMNLVAAEVASLAAEKIVGITLNQAQAMPFVEDAGKKKAA